MVKLRARHSSQHTQQHRTSTSYIYSYICSGMRKMRRTHRKVRTDFTGSGVRALPSHRLTIHGRHLQKNTSARRALRRIREHMPDCSHNGTDHSFVIGVVDGVDSPQWLFGSTNKKQGKCIPGRLRARCSPAGRWHTKPALAPQRKMRCLCHGMPPMRPPARIASTQRSSPSPLR